MRVNSDLLKHFEFLTMKFDGTHGFLYSTVSFEYFREGGDFCGGFKLEESV